ncbi:MAG: hypothetical protein IJ481_03935 [Alphaproteobacteria bacterium]|nr:hypothetical protein [Alphaproteobacteria bacterium]
MSLYASTIAVPIKVNNPITIGSTPSVPTETDYNYWLDDKTYVFHRDKDKNNKYWKANNTVTIDKDYTLKLIKYYSGCTLDCYNTFTNDGNVIIDDYGVLGLNYTSINTGTIDVNNGMLALWNSTLTNKGTITFKDSSYIDIYSNSTLNNTGTITFKDSGFIDVYVDDTLTNKGTIDISNITDLSNWYNEGTFKLERGSIFILPKSISTPNSNKFKIILNGTDDDKPVNIVIPKDCKYIKYIDNNNKGVLFNAIEDATGFIFNGDKDNVKFSWQTPVDN